MLVGTITACGSVCSVPLVGPTSVVLTGVAAPGYELTGWLGPCTGFPACTVDVPDGANVFVQAIFSQIGV